MAFAWPGITLASLVLLYAAYCFADGIVALLGGSSGRLWQSLLIGVISVAAGVAALFYPGLTALVLLYLIGAWAIVRGVFEIAAAVALRKVIEGELMLILAGLFSIAFGVFVLLFPGAGALSVIWILEDVRADLRRAAHRVELPGQGLGTCVKKVREISASWVLGNREWSREAR